MTHSARTTLRLELRGCYSASAARLTVDLESRRRGCPICALARELIESGHDLAALRDNHRAGILCFKPMPLDKWAGLAVEEGDKSRKSARFAKYRPPSSRVAGESAETGVGLDGSIGHRALPATRVPESANAALSAAPTAGS